MLGPSKDIQFSVNGIQVDFEAGPAAQLTKQCTELANLKNQHSLRLSYLYDVDEKDIKIPKIQIYTQNKYKHQEIPQMSVE